MLVDRVWAMRRGTGGCQILAAYARVGKFSGVYPCIALRRCLASHPATQPQHMEQLLLLQKDEPIFKPLSSFKITNLWGCDFGSGYFHAWRDGSCIKLMPQDFASLDFANPGDVVIIENAHMQPKKESLAQVFTFDELMKIKETAVRKKISIRLWFHSQTPKWRAMLGMGDKSDAVDAETIARIAQRRGIIDLQYFNPRESYPERIQWAHEQVNDMNETLNIARFDYLVDTVPCVREYNNGGKRGSQFIGWKKRGAHDSISCDINRWFCGETSFKQGISLWSALVDWEGNPRMYKGKQPGIKFVMNELLRMRPNHFKGGVARSNLMHHGFRNVAIKALGTRAEKLKLHQFTPSQREKWLALRQQYRRAMVAALHDMQTFLNS
jgi:hypothetical protein